MLACQIVDLVRSTAVLCSSLLLVGCGALPRDHAGTLDRLRDGELRAGAAAHPPWVRVENGRPTGLEVDLIEAWAGQLGARVRWTVASEPELVDALHHQDLDVVVAALSKATPYKPKLALTQPYATSRNAYGSTVQHVIATRPGDSALLFALDRFLAAHKRGEAVVPPDAGRRR